MAGRTEEKVDNLIEYERSILGSILVDNRVIEEYDIQDSFFTTDYTRRVWDWIKKTKARGAVANIMEIALGMPDKAAEVATLTDYASMANVGVYIKDLSERSRVQAVMSMMRHVGNMKSDGATYAEMRDYIDKSMVHIDGLQDVGYKHIRDAVPETIRVLEEIYRNKGKMTGIPTGFQSLDDKTNGWQNQDYIVIGARPSVGKTAGMLNCASSALRHGFKVGIFSAEMNTRSLLTRMISDWGNIESNKLRNGFMAPSDLASLSDVCKNIAETGLYINDTPNISLQALISDARKMKWKEHVDIIFIDYMGLICNEKPNMKRYEQVSEISRNMKGLARELDIPIVVLSQLNRESHGNKPTIADLRESGSIEQDADIIILLQDLGYTDDTETCKKVKWIVGKQRNGSTGEISMIFKGAYMRVRESEERWDDAPAKKDQKYGR